MYTFDDLRLMQRLSALMWPAPPIFAAACAERLFTGYQGYVAASGDGDTVVLRIALDTLWESLANGAPPADFGRLADECENLVPDMLTDPWSLDGQYAEDAVGATVFALRCAADRDPRHAFDSAARAHDSVDAILQYELDVDYTTTDGERRMQEHPLTQAEFGRQDRDLTELATAAPHDLAACGARLRERAAAEPIHPPAP